MITAYRFCRVLLCVAFCSLAAGCTTVTRGNDHGSSVPSSGPGQPDVVLNFRPLVMPPVTWTTPPGSARTADPLKGLTFPVPVVDTAYYKLTRPQQRQLRTRLATFDCSSDQHDSAAQPLLACDSKDPGKATLVYLLGAVIVPGTEIAGATATPPTVSGSTEWTVTVELKPDAATAWATYTGAHNTGGQNPAEPITACGSAGTPCADYVAVTVDGAVISSPYLQDVISNGSTQISGNFTAESARRLAEQLNG